MEIEKLMQIGEKLGHQGPALQAFITGEQNRLRDVRAEERDRMQEEKELVGLQLDLEKTRAENGQRNQGNQGLSNVLHPPKLPLFVCGTDCLDTYINRFERYATAQAWPLVFGLSRPSYWKGSRHLREIG